MTFCAVTILCPLRTTLTLVLLFAAVNSSYNVGIPQQRRIQEEFYRAVLKMGKVEDKWGTVYEPTDFFERHANYLVITIR